MKKFTRDAMKSARAHVSEGNRKVGDIPNFSLTPGRTCSATACATCLREGCYAMKSYRMYPTVKRAWDENSDLAEKNPAALEAFLRLYLSAEKPAFFRVHVGGDFVSRVYAEMWARVSADYPETRFLAFTKQWENVRGVDFPANFSLVLSGWEGTEIPADLAARYPSANCILHAEDMPEGGILCPGSCESCGMCWNLGKIGRDVYFVKH